MQLVVFAAALALLARGPIDLQTFRARTEPEKQAYLACLTAQAAAKYRGRDSDELARQILASCRGGLETWMDAMAKAQNAKPQALAAARKAVQPLLPNLAHLAVKAQAERLSKSAPAPEFSGPVTRRAPPPEPGENDRAGPTPLPAVACGGVAVITDPSALSCRD